MATKVNTVPAPTLSTKVTKAAVFNAASAVVVWLVGLLVSNPSTVTPLLLKWGVPAVFVNAVLVVFKDWYDRKKAAAS